MSETDVVMMMKWGTWEELLLGGAVLRHGTQAWDAVAAEIRSRTLYPFFFTAEVCKAKYEDLRERYCGCSSAWFEELRKRRVAELKRELEKSDDSIGSLETKLESLKEEKEEEEEEEDCNVKYDDSNRTESPISDGSTERVEFSGKETSNSKDGLSAGSFTEEIRTTWSPEQNQIPVTESTQETEIIKLEEIDEKKTCVELIGGNLRKRRGKRKRKDCSNNNQINQVKEVKEGSVGDSDVFRTVADHTVVVDTQQRDCDDRVDHPMGTDDRENVDLMEILNSFMENEKENAAVFRCRLDSQKTARYKKTIRCHLDFHRVRSRINDRSITTDRELFRDLLLLSNNALVFYPKSSPEFTAAMSLRELAVKTFRQDRSVSTRDSGVDGSCGGNDDCAAVVVIESKPCNPPVKLPRSVRPRSRKVVKKVVNSTEETPDQTIEITKKTPCEIEDIPLADSLPLVASKKGRVRAGKVGGRSGEKRAETSPVKGKKRSRRR